MVKRLPTMRETRVRSLGWEDALEKEMVTHSNTLAWKIHEWRSVVGYGSWGCKESDMNERLHFLSFIPLLPCTGTILNLYSPRHVFYFISPSYTTFMYTYINISLILASINFSFGS